jgi:hypothetical protein
LGHKTITKVTVIRPESDDDNDFVDASLVFHVGDVVPPPEDEGEGVHVKLWEELDGEDVRVHGFEI